eukprot:CAMPEP_0197234718 /NCGR_PEP_ID=MMETSP1429-20130617/2393_1 /TAXON_ID=49237 /ORGANISM="Chaetoceros  sp., Strain UNC1202" /LENGTH=406 /DNA_ID=CAMNT_0042693195 /DNA_START=86 /DNA_END=1306 /DNA_ORIENTATION=-
MSAASSKNIDFIRSFKTVGSHPSTQTCLKAANSARAQLHKTLTESKRNPPNKSIAAAAENYINPIQQILLACRVQPESARLDQRLVFEWSTGVEAKERLFKSEAIMYELVMAIATKAIATAGVGIDECSGGDFASACRNFKSCAGIFDFLASTQLPQWLAKGGKIDDEALPAEAKVGTCEALSVLYLGIAQQMAIATVLMKKGTPNWSILAKLSLGIAEIFEEFATIMRSKAAVTKSKLDPEFFTLITFQIEVQRSLSLYFHARHYWETESQYGLAIAMMNKAIQKLNTRDSPTGKGLPEIKPKSSLKAVEKDLVEVRTHMAIVLQSWEKDNSGIYFDKVPLVIPAEKTLDQGTHMMKAELFELDEVEPVALILPGADCPKSGGNSEQTDSDAELARKLQEQLNAE